MTMTIRPEHELNQRLDHPAEASQRSKSHPAAQANCDPVDLNEWQIREIRNAIAEADSDEFASDDLVRDTLGRWGIDAD